MVDGRSCRDVLEWLLASRHSSPRAVQQRYLLQEGKLTNDRLYESKDSLEMPKWSISPKLLLVSVEFRERYLRGHWPCSCSSVGEGYRTKFISTGSIHRVQVSGSDRSWTTYGKIDAAINDC